jgi:hypothetical protein
MKFNVKVSEKTRRELTPQRGVHYMTEEDVSWFLERVTPRYKVDYFTDTEVEELRKTLTPNLEDIYAQLTPFATRDKLISIEVEEDKLPITAIKNLPEILRNIYARGGGQYSNIGAATITARTPSAITSDVVSVLQFSTDFTLTSSDGGTQIAVSLASSSGTPGGSDTQVQFNDGGAFGGDAEFLYNKTTNTLTIPNIISGGAGTNLSLVADSAFTLDSTNAGVIIRGATNTGVSSNSGSTIAYLDTATTQTADRTYIFPDASGTFALANSSLSGYVLKAGDTMTGTLGFSSALNAGTILTVPDSDGSTYSDYTFHLGGGDNATGAGFNTFSFEMTANTTGASNFRNILYYGIVDQVSFENVGGYTFAFERFTSPGEGWSFSTDARMSFSAVTDISFRMTDGAGSGAAGQFTFNDNAASGGAGEMRFLTAAAHRLIQTSVTQFTNTGAIAFGGGLALTLNDSGKIQIRTPAMTIVGGTSFGTVNIQQVGTRTVPSSTTAFVGDLTIVPGTTSVSSGATLTTLAGLYISGAPTKSGTGTLSNGPYSVHIDAGTSRFDGDIQMLGDNVSTIYGAGLDASIYYDGTNFIFNPKLVGTGYVDILGALQLDAGTSTSNVKVGGKLTTNTTTVGNVTTGEDNLMTYSVPANTLSTNGDTLRFYASGTFTANANSKQLKVYFGSTAVSPPLDTTTNAIDWSVTGEIIRTGATTQKMWVSFTSWDGTASVTFVDYVTPAETLSGAVTFKLTGEGTSTDDIKQETLTVDWLPV